MRPVATAVASGSLSSLVIALAREFILSQQVSIPELVPSPSLTQDLCSFTEAVLPREWALDPYSLLIGLLLGLSVGPLIDLLFIIRLAWGRFLRSYWSGNGRPLYRVLE